MKILFAVSNEKISESIIKKYESIYKEIVSSKNVYYFNAILKELQKDKSYDRVVISEDLEPFTNNNYDVTDNFIFEKLDRISDEAVDHSGEDIPIILITSDRRTKGEAILSKLFGIGIYSALIGQDRTVQQLCELINKPRTKKEAKSYYKIDSNETNYISESEDNVSELEIQNILAHYKKLGKNEEKYVESFDSIANQYTDEQLKVIIKFLPIGVKAVLEEKSPKYQQISTFTGESNNLKKQKPYASSQINPKTNKPRSSTNAVLDNGIKIESIGNEVSKKLTKPVIIPQTLSTSNVRKIQKSSANVTQREQPKVEPKVQQNVIATQPKVQQNVAAKQQQVMQKVQQNTVLTQKKAVQDMTNILQQEVNNIQNNTNVNERVESVNMEELQEPKRGRGRPRKILTPEEIALAKAKAEAPKRGRGRPRKVQVSSEIIDNNQNDIYQEESLPGIQTQEEVILPQVEEPIEPMLPQIEEPMEAVLPQIDEYEETVLPQVEESKLEPVQQQSSLNYDEDLSFDDDNDLSFDNDTLSFDNDNDTLSFDEDNGAVSFDEDNGAVSFDDDELSFGEDIEDNTEDILPGFDTAQETNNDEDDDFSFLEDDEPTVENYENEVPAVERYEDDELLQDIDDSEINNINNYSYSTNNTNVNVNKNNESISRYNAPSNVDLSNLLSSEKKLVAFVGTSKNGTSFLVNNIADMLSNQGIRTAILDLTKNRNSYYIYTKNEEDLRKIATECINKLAYGTPQGIPVNKNLDVYTCLPGENNQSINKFDKILETLINNYSLVLLDCDFNSEYEYLRQAQEIYLVQSMDVLTIQPLTAYLRDLKAKNVLDQEKLRIVINKYTKVRSVTEKTIIGGMAFYNDPSMSFMTELFNREKVRYTVIPFDVQTYSRYLEGLINCNISCNGYSKEFMSYFSKLSNMVYPLINNNIQSRQNKSNNQKYNNKYTVNNAFSNDMNNTLDKMKNKF